MSISRAANLGVKKEQVGPAPVISPAPYGLVVVWLTDPFLVTIRKNTPKAVKKLALRKALKCPDRSG
jgi:hypothetical protein